MSRRTGDSLATRVAPPGGDSDRLHLSLFLEVFGRVWGRSKQYHQLTLPAPLEVVHSFGRRPLSDRASTAKGEGGGGQLWCRRYAVIRQSNCERAQPDMNQVTNEKQMEHNLNTLSTGPWKNLGRGAALRRIRGWSGAGFVG